MTRTEEEFQGAKNTQLFARGYRPTTGDVRGVVVFVSGFKDHGDHYAEFSQRLAHHGYAAYAFDNRGFGRSAGARVEIDRFDDFLDDLALYVARIKAREPGKPIFVYGHSLGGLIVTLYGVERHPPVDGLIVSGPGIELDGPLVQNALVRLFDDVAPQAPIFPLPNENFTRNASVVAGMGTDPLIDQPNAPAHTAGEAVDAIHRVWAHPEQLTVPLLAIHGTADKLTAPTGSRDLVALAGSTDKTLRLYNGYYHDLIHEPGKERVFADVTAWLDAHTGGSPMPRDADTETLVKSPLKGDAASGSTDVQIDARGEHAASGGPFAATGGLRFRQGVGRIGWLGGVDLRAGSDSGFLWLADAHLLGLGARFGDVQLGATGGIGALGIDGTTWLHTPAELSVDASLGPVRLLSRAGATWNLNHGGPGTTAGGIADELNALVGVRFGRDIFYWGDLRAGQGPFLGATYTRREGADLWGVVLGLDLWGAR